jgi:hypothetical protein
MKGNIVKKMKMVRQGDVLVECVDERPPKAAIVRGRPILAHGEAAGHAHEIEDRKVAEVADVTDRWRVQGDLTESLLMTRKLLVLSKDSAVVHQEHARIPLKKGAYRVTRQREYAPEAIRNVQD